jgi:hypothetical protein
MIWGVPFPNDEFDFMYTFNPGGNDGITTRYEFHDGWGASRQVIVDP